MLPHRNEKKESKAPYSNTTESQKARAGSQQKKFFAILAPHPGSHFLHWNHVPGMALGERGLKKREV